MDDPASTPPGPDGTDEVGQPDEYQTDAGQADAVSDGMEHLQTAARELVAAARSFLDVVEQVVEDDQRMAGAASSFADLIGRGLGAASARDLGALRDLGGGLLGDRSEREPSWLRNDPDHPDAPGDVFGHDDATPPSPSDESLEGDEQLRGDGSAAAASRRAPATRPSDSPRRVRRIAVD